MHILFACLHPVQASSLFGTSITKDAPLCVQPPLGTRHNSQQLEGIAQGCRGSVRELTARGDGADTAGVTEVTHFHFCYYIKESSKGEERVLKDKGDIDLCLQLFTILIILL